MNTVLVLTALTLREAVRRRVLWALGLLSVALLGLSAWGLSRLAGVEHSVGGLTGLQARLVASQLLNLVMFGLSLIGALGTAFLAGPTLAGEVESGVVLAVLARPVRRWQLLLGKWLGLVTFGCGYVVVAGLAELLVVRATVNYWPHDPVGGLALLAVQTLTLLTLALLLSSVISPLASGIVSVGLFGAAWVAGVVGGVGAALDNAGVERVGTVSRAVLPTDGLWHGAMDAFQDPAAIAQFPLARTGNPFMAQAPASIGYLVWVAVWIAVVWALTALSFHRRDL